MCGIAGYVQRTSSGPDVIARMTAKVAHRGPDGSGMWGAETDGWAVRLGHRRLSIIDPAGGHQPLATTTGRTWITYNGEVYNFNELRAALAARGHQFATHCDTEVVAAHWQEHGPDGLAALDGMFALAVWDVDAGQLMLARDRAGVKPLYYAPLPDGGIAFASELGALLVHPGVDRQLSVEGMAAYFFADYAAAPGTIVRGARKLEPGQAVAWDVRAGLGQPWNYWRPPALARRGHRFTACQERDVVEALRDGLDEAVHSQLVADVPVGVFLSGGIDSSLIAALAARHTGEQLRTFSIGFTDPAFDESRFARRVAEHIGSRHEETVVGEIDLLAALDDALDSLDEPMADPSILPTFLLSRAAARRVKVCLGGDGGDELWGGYPTYKAHRYAEAYGRFPRAVRERIVNPLVARLPVRAGYQSLEWKAKRFFLRWDANLATRHRRWMSSVDRPAMTALFARRDDVNLFGVSAMGDNDVDPLDVAGRLDFSGYLPGSVLTKVDRASMANGLEVRPPMLANALVDLALSVPMRAKTRGRAKQLLKRAATGLLPADIIHRRKRGFAIPLSRWLNGSLRPRIRHMVADSPLWNEGILDQACAQRWLAEHEAATVDWSRPLWALLVLDHWYRGVWTTRLSERRVEPDSQAHAIVR